MIDHITVHPESKIGQARMRLEQLRADVHPRQAHLASLRSERAQKQAIVDSASLDSDPMEIATANLRLGLLDKAIAAAASELGPMLKRLEEAEQELRDLERDYELKLYWYGRLQDALDDDVEGQQVRGWLNLLRDVRQRIQELVEGPIEPGAHWEPVIEVRFELMQSGQKRPRREPAVLDLAREAFLKERGGWAPAVSFGKRSSNEVLKEATAHLHGDMVAPVQDRQQEAAPVARSPFRRALRSGLLEALDEQPEMKR